jgi:hypothetical protein
MDDSVGLADSFLDPLRGRYWCRRDSRHMRQTGTPKSPLSSATRKPKRS